jgi:hypothetical protein
MTLSPRDFERNQKKVHELLGIPLKPFVSDEDD